MSLIALIILIFLVFMPGWIQFKYRNQDTTLNALIFSISVLLGFLQFPFEHHLTLDSEAYTAYVKPLLELAPPSYDLINYIEPSFGFLIVFLNRVFDLHYVVALQLLRFLFFILTLFAFKSTLQNISLDKSKNSSLVALGVFLMAIDWNFNFLLFGDQFRQVTGNLFYIYSLQFLVSKNLKLFAFYSLAATLGHRSFFIISISTYVLFLIEDRYQFFNNRKKLLLTPILSIGSFLLLKFSLQWLNKNGLDFFDLAYRIENTNNMGWMQAFWNKPGVILATAMYLTIIGFGVFYYNQIKNNSFVRLSFVFLIFSLILARLGIINIAFLEPNRIYIFSLPFFVVSFCVILNVIKPWQKYLGIIFFVVINFLFKNFSKESYKPTLHLLKSDFVFGFNFLQSYEQTSGLVLFILFLVLILLTKISINVLLLTSILSTILIWFSNSFYLFTIFPVLLLLNYQNHSPTLSNNGLFSFLSLIIILSTISCQITYTFFVNNDFTNYIGILLNTFSTLIIIFVTMNLILNRNKNKLLN